MATGPSSAGDPVPPPGGVSSLRHFYLSTLPRWYVWLVMDAGCALFGHTTFVCWNGRNWRNRLLGWTLDAPLPFAGGLHGVVELPTAITHEIRRHVWPR